MTRQLSILAASIALAMMATGSVANAADMLVSQNLGSGAYSADASYSSSYLPPKAFDGGPLDGSSQWNAGSGGTHWIEANLGKVYKLSKIVFSRIQGATGDTIRIKHGLTSNPSTLETTLTTAANTFTYTYPTQDEAQYVRIDSTMATWVNWYEVKIYAASSTLTGTVTSATPGNPPIVGATVATADRKYSTSTDASGTYTLSVPAGTESFLVSKSGGNMQVVGESMVLPAQIPGNLCFNAIVPGTIVVRSTYLPGQAGTITYQLGTDYVVDNAQGTIARTAASSIPDFSTNILYGKTNFDHSQYPGYGNTAFLVFVDYETYSGLPFATATNQAALLTKTSTKLLAGGPFKIIAFGDSIAAGGEASSEALRFPNRYAQMLQTRFPQAQITLENGSTGGDTSTNGLARLQEKVLSRSPNLVLVAFGMNDHNIAGYGVPVATFSQNLTTMVNSIVANTGAEVILISAFPPNPEWAFGSHQMGNYAAATQRVAASQHCAYADVYSIWTRVLQRKDPPSMLGNDINHPTDFGHWLYLQGLEAVEF